MKTEAELRKQLEEGSIPILEALYEYRQRAGIVYDLRRYVGERVQHIADRLRWARTGSGFGDYFQYQGFSEDGDTIIAEWRDYRDGEEAEERFHQDMLAWTDSQLNETVNKLRKDREDAEERRRRAREVDRLKDLEREREKLDKAIARIKESP